ncbi:DUF1642 domain-containing protein [Listeria seeligeri]|uniref:DUF1642 domain-containing protein n=1 Tax=Listeria seeligeri TaxID=1640 RepID=UPI002F3EBB06
MKFKEGDKVQFIREGSLMKGIIQEIRTSHYGASYIVASGYGKPRWINEGRLIPLTPLPVVPQFVADWIEKKKENGDDLLVALDKNWQGMEDSVRDWFDAEKERYELFARAWLDGYEIEQEPLYYVMLPYLSWNGSYSLPDTLNTYLMLNEVSKHTQIASNNIEYGNWIARITEKQIKAIDERYWAFAVPAEEVEVSE